jgi:hypothetical protein
LSIPFLASKKLFFKNLYFIFWKILIIQK